MTLNIRNFSIIAHVDHGKRTLADRMLELTGTIEPRRMQEQVLDQMDLERERGITIKMQPVRMLWRTSNSSGLEEEYILNLIDTPGHVDFAYEVSRALSAVEGVVLLVDATQGVEAQTLSVLSVAKELDLVIIPVVSKIDAPNARISDIQNEIALLLGCPEKDVLLTSGKTGQGVKELLDSIVERVPPPKISGDKTQALVFDFRYSDHRGVIIYARIFGGHVTKGDTVRFAAAYADFTALEVGVLRPGEFPRATLSEGEIGYIVTGIKKPGIASVGDTIIAARGGAEPLPGYRSPTPVIWASVYPESQDDLVTVRQSLERLRLSDSSLSYEEESSGVMGKGFRCGFVEMPLRELMRGFFDRLKSVSSGYASLSYELAGLRDADVVRLDVLVAEEAVPAFARIVSRRRMQEEAESLVEKLQKLLPRQMFELKIQAKVGGRIIASRRISAMRKDVTGYLYGGDITRKMKLLEKQKKGKKKMLARGKVDIPHEVFLKVIRGSSE